MCRLSVPSVLLLRSLASLPFGPLRPFIGPLRPAPFVSCQTSIQALMIWGSSQGLCSMLQTCCIRISCLGDALRLVGATSLSCSSRRAASVVCHPRRSPRAKVNCFLISDSVNVEWFGSWRGAFAVNLLRLHARHFCHSQ